MELVDNGKRPIQNSHDVTEIEAMEEEMFLGLRKAEGVSISLFQKRFGKSLEEVYGQTLQSLTDRGLIEQSGGKVKLTRIGVFRGNEVFQEFLK